jgi:hypothetical protein
MGLAVQVNAQYNIAAPESIPVRIAGHQRRKMFESFLNTTGIRPDDTVLDIGVTSDQSYEHSNYFEHWYPHKCRITACGLDDATFLEQIYPGMRVVRADGRALPFADREFGYVHSSAVLEHVGSREMQERFLREAWRVARKGLFITTPNRWFPIEFHTVLPLVHWLPAQQFRFICAHTHRSFFAEESNLNLLSAADLNDIAGKAGISDPTVSSVRLLRWPSNLLLAAHRRTL